MRNSLPLPPAAERQAAAGACLRVRRAVSCSISRSIFAVFHLRENIFAICIFYRSLPNEQLSDLISPSISLNFPRHNRPIRRWAENGLSVTIFFSPPSRRCKFVSAAGIILPSSLLALEGNTASFRE